MSFLLNIHQDGEPEGNEYFDLFLYEPWGGARLGSQQRTRVTIIDADSNGTTTDYSLTTFYSDEDVSETEEIHVLAGAVNSLTLVAKDAFGRARGFGGGVFTIWVDAREEEGGSMEDLAVKRCSVK